MSRPDNPNQQPSEPLPGASGILEDEADVRAMRDRVMGHQTGENNWLACREGWMKFGNVRWLREHDYPL